ncbi:FAD-dependent thymidylate synthase [Candidatus Micrarchaeota archaeon]|nr:FAD-dependent thymidylate synthase [Candidatus Micrarchaeota archaeon]
MEFNDKEQAILKPYFTNLDQDVFALRNLPEVVKGALFSRYSRTTKSLRRVLLDEFIQDQDMAFDQIVSAPTKDETVAIQKAEQFYDRVLVGFGDDSVAELGGAHIAIENTSNVVTKILEDGRIGLSPLEKSTRYVYFNQKKNGKYAYYREPLLMETDSALYEKTCDALFDAYTTLMDPVTKYVQEKFPQTDSSDRAYQSATRAKVCDILRGLLPAATQTNVGLFGNGRAFEYLLLKMYASPLQEARDTAAAMHAELEKVVPSFVKRANDKHGKATQAFFQQTQAQLQAIATPSSTQNREVILVEYDEKAEDKIVAAILYESSHADLATLKQTVSKMTPDQKQHVLDAYCAHRQNRRHKPGRAFEHANYTFSIQANYGAYRDLQRHRMLTQHRQLLTTNHGFDLPPEIVDADLKEQFTAPLLSAQNAYNEFKDQPGQAQYVVPMAFRLQWYFTLNLRALYHLVELRSMPQGHPDYRRVAVAMADEAAKAQPRLTKYMKFVHRNQTGLERIESEKKIDEKIRQVKEKYG